MNDLNEGGQSLWDMITADHDLDATQQVQLLEACRVKDRLDKLDALLRGDIGTWASVDFDHDGTPVSLRIDGAAKLANESANLLKQLLAALRLPDAQTGKKPQYRGPRGAQAPTVPGGKISSLDRARARKTGS